MSTADSEEMRYVFWNYIRLTEENRPHSKVGWSPIDECMAKQYFDKINNVEFDGYQFTAPGTIFHKYAQEEVIPPGTEMRCDNEFAKKSFDVIGHEVPVFCRINGTLRYSYIDTLVYNVLDNCIEVWDWKTEGFAKYKKDKVKAKHVAQVNLYGYLIKAARIRICYIDKKQYDEQYWHTLPVNEEMAKETLLRMVKLDTMVQNKVIDIPYHELADGLMDEVYPKNDCQYCRYNKDGSCLQKFCSEFAKPFRTLGDVADFITVMGGNK